jgi:cytochrome c peroxidase
MASTFRPSADAGSREPTSRNTWGGHINGRLATSAFALTFASGSALAAPSAVLARDRGPALSPIEQLGKALFFDGISNPDSMSCATCHAPQTGWTGPIPGINKHGSVYRGAVPQRFGNRKPPYPQR